MKKKSRKNPKLSLGSEELGNLKAVYNIDLSDPNELKIRLDRIREYVEPFSEIRRGLNNDINPHRKKRIPSGNQCSFCFKRENEVSGMAKHESGFNLCQKCIKRLNKKAQE
jgi:hypothetical protein